MTNWTRSWLLCLIQRFLSWWGNVTIYSEMGNGKQLMWHVVAAPEKDEAPETIFITLNEGDQLKSGVPFSLTAGSGIVFR